MKKTLLHFVLLSLFVPAPAWGAGQAQFHLYGLSLRFQPATTTSLGLEYTLELTTDSPAASVLNGELAPLSAGSPSSHGSFYRLTGAIFFEPVIGSFFLNLPNAQDANTNNVADFFEVSQAVSATATSGTFEDLDRSGKVTTTWSREANSPKGACRLVMDAYGLTFNCAYEIQEFAGLLNYSTSTTNVTGSVVLTNTLNPSKKLSGRVELDKISAEQLSLRAGTWTNQTGQSVTFLGSPELDRFAIHYVDFFAFKDGDLETSAEDYIIWWLRISDSNDANGNRIPDLSDVPIPRSPSISLRHSSNQLLLSLSGEIGKRHDIERVSALGQTNWTLTSSVTLTNDPQIVTLAAPTNGVAFWRVKAP